MLPSSFASIFAQVTNAAVNTAASTDASGTPLVNPPQAPWWTSLGFPVLLMLALYFAMIRPQMQATKQKQETIKSAKTGDRVVTSSGIHGTITNVKDSTVIVRVADNVKLEIEKSHIEKITREAADSLSEKAVTAKA